MCSDTMMGSIHLVECVEKLGAHDMNAVADLDEQLAAFDELQMVLYIHISIYHCDFIYLFYLNACQLVESIDNSNDLRPLALWQPIMNILSSHKSSKMRMYAAWVIGTALQNNETAQKDVRIYLIYQLNNNTQTNSSWN
jgi:hypothetical protein